MGTLDGVERISRLGEELYHTDNYVGIVKGPGNHCPICGWKPGCLLSANVYRLKGMNHNSFTYDNDDDTVPDWVLENDLKAEISKEGAITSITEFAAHFMDFCQR